MDSSEKMNSNNYMDNVLVKAAAEGNINPFKDYQTCLDQLLTPNENTILHVYLRNRRIGQEVIDFVDQILEMCPPLLLQTNKKGETPLHLAARYGHSNVVNVLIDRAKGLPTDPKSGVTGVERMLRMANEEQDTALHEAARNTRSDVVEILTKEDPKFSYSANIHGETPLYIAASIGRKRDAAGGMVIDEILKNCISVDYGSPNGRTALHAAITKGDYVTVRKMLEKEKNLTKTTDQNGWSPLHYAAYFGCIFVVKVLLEYDASAVYIADTKRKRTALHVAAIRGHVGVMKEIVSRCLACCEQVDNRGWNALHYAVASKRTRLFSQCLKIPELVILGTEKDDKGNTPFHLLAAAERNHSNMEYFNLLHNRDFKSDIYGLNEQKLSVEDILEGNFSEIQNKEILESLEDVGSGPVGSERIILKEEEKNKEREASSYKKKAIKTVLDRLNKAREYHLVVAALIATVTFAAAFTLPGGYKNEEGPNQGTAILSKKAAFIVFIISDAISMVLSISAVFIHSLMPLFPGVEEKGINLEIHIKLLVLASLLNMIAMGSMVIAFVTATYTVLVPSLGLAITTCLTGLSFFFLVCIVLRIVFRRYRIINLHNRNCIRSILDLILG